MKENEREPSPRSVKESAARSPKSAAGETAPCPICGVEMKREASGFFIHPPVEPYCFSFTSAGPVMQSAASELLCELSEAAKQLVQEYWLKYRLSELDTADFREVFEPILNRRPLSPSPSCLHATVRYLPGGMTWCIKCGALRYPQTDQWEASSSTSDSGGLRTTDER